MEVYYTAQYRGGRTASRALLRQAIGQYLPHIRGERRSAEELMNALTTGRNGKPEIEGFSAFSVSHSGSCWAVLFDCEACGLDLQEEKAANYEAIAAKFYTEREAELVARDGGTAFFRIWARREALIKALSGTVFQETPDVQAEREEAEIVCEDAHWYLRDLTLPLPVYAAICTKRQGTVSVHVLEETEKE